MGGNSLHLEVFVLFKYTLYKYILLLLNLNKTFENTYYALLHVFFLNYVHLKFSAV
jgi:hypothetical protein